MVGISAGGTAVPYVDVCPDRTTTGQGEEGDYYEGAFQRNLDSISTAHGANDKPAVNSAAEGAATHAALPPPNGSFAIAMVALAHGWRVDAVGAQLATRRNAAVLTAGVNTARHDAYTELLRRGFRTALQGVAMTRPNGPGYNRADVYLIDDWR